MTKNATDKFRLRAEVMKALGHPTRLFIVDELSKGEKCVCELTAMIGADTSTVSKHLSVLKNSGLVTDDKRGLQVYYNLTTPCVMNFMSCVENVIRERIGQQAGMVEI